MSNLDLLQRWEHQQAAYIADRENRFRIMLDVLDLQSAGRPAVVVDLACGPGSLAFRVLERFPGARVVGVDHDPALLSLACEAGVRYGERAVFVDGDLTAPAWVEELRAHLDGATVSGG